MVFGNSKTWKFPGWLLLIVLLTFLTFLAGVRIPFVAEDFYFLANANTSFNDAWQSMLDSCRIWPLGVAYRWLLFQAFGLNVAGYHLFSILVHVANVVLVYLVARRLTKSQLAGLLASLVFAVYPRHHQPVLWMTANQVLVFTFFGLICLYAFLRYSETARIRWLALTVLALTLAVLTQEGAIILFPLIFLMDTILPDGLLLQRFRSRQFYLKYLPIVIIFLGFVWMNFGGARAFKLSVAETSQAELAGLGISGDSYHMNKLGPKTLQEMATYVTYATYPQITLRSLDPNLLTVLLAGGTCTVLLLIFLKGSRIIRFAVLWLSIALVPYVLFTPFGNADRYFYFASIGFSLLAAALLRWLFEKLAAHRAAGYGILVLAGVYTFSGVLLIQQRIGEWQAAGEIATSLAEQVVQSCPEPEPGDTILFAGVLPDRYGQAYIYNGGGIGPQLTLAYGERAERVRILQTTDQEVCDYLVNAPVVENPIPRLHVFLYDAAMLQDRSASVDRINTLNPDSWFK
jgi:hypothetical protein